MNITRIFAYGLIAACVFAHTWCVAADDYVSTVYVAPTGADSNPGTLQQPMKTLAVARDCIRQFRKTASTGAYRIVLRGGEYFTDGVEFGPADSSEKSGSLVIESEGFQRATLVNGRELSLASFQR